MLNEIHFHRGLHDKHLFVRKNKLISKAKLESACAISHCVCFAPQLQVRQFVAFFLKVKVILIHHGSRVGITGGSSIGGSGVITSGGSSSAGGGSSSQGMREFL